MVLALATTVGSDGCGGGGGGFFVKMLSVPSVLVLIVQHAPGLHLTETRAPGGGANHICGGKEGGGRGEEAGGKMRTAILTVLKVAAGVPTCSRTRRYFSP